MVSYIMPLMLLISLMLLVVLDVKYSFIKLEVLDILEEMLDILEVKFQFWSIRFAVLSSSIPVSIRLSPVSAPT